MSRVLLYKLINADIAKYSSITLSPKLLLVIYKENIVKMATNVFRRTPLKCDFVGCEKKSFSTPWVLSRHIERMHSSEYRCSDCDQIFESRYQVTEHKKRDHRVISCNICFTRFSNHQSLRRHGERFHKEAQVATHMCVPCNLQFKSKGHYDLHVLDVHTNETSFKIMNEAFKNVHQDWRKILATKMSPESLLYGEYNQEIVNFLKDQQARMTTFTYNIVLACIYESSIPEKNIMNDMYRKGKILNISLLFLSIFFISLFKDNS